MLNDAMMRYLTALGFAVGLLAFWVLVVRLVIICFERGI